MIDALFKISMGGLLIATMPSTGNSELWAQWGLAGAVVAFTLARDWHREKRLNDRDDRVNNWIQNTLVSALNRNSTAIEKMTKLERDREHSHVG